MATVKVRCSKCNAQGFWPADNTTYRCWSCEFSTNIGANLPPQHRQGFWQYIKQPHVFKGLSNDMQYGASNTKPSPNPCCPLKTGPKCGLLRDPQINMSSPYTSMNTEQADGLTGRPNKRALLCGVTYTNNRKYMLKGTVNDVKDMRELLIKQYKYSPHCVRVLTESEPKEEYRPTKKNIENSLKWLVEGCESGDSLVFYFSGHGLRQPDFEIDEIDGFDETICPVDFMENGMIVDNDINTTIVKPLKKGVKLHAIVDACHSGTILDLQFFYDLESKDWQDQRPPSGVSKSTSGGWAISLSACEDNQLAADTTAFGKKMNGASTYIFIEIIKQNPDLTYGKLLEYLSETFDENSAKQVKWLNSRILGRLFGHTIKQKPLLSSSKRFDVYSTKFGL